MIALLAAAALRTAAPSASPVPDPVTLAPAAVVAKYQAALATVKEPRVFAVEYTLEQIGPRTLDQAHRIFRSGGDERDETLAVNGTRSTQPFVRLFRGRPYRYTVRALAPKPTAYDFTYAGPHKHGQHVDYVFRLTPKQPSPAFAFTEVTIDGITFLPDAVAFTTPAHGGSGTVTFAKSGRWWVASSAAASARVPGGLARERISFNAWRFPASLPQSTFAPARPLKTPPPGIP